MTRSDLFFLAAGALLGIFLELVKGRSMRTLFLLAALFATGCAIAPPAAPPPSNTSTVPGQPPGHIELSQAVCAHGMFGFHFKTDGPTEGNAYFRLMQLAALCRQGQDEDDAPQPQRDDKPLPPGTSRL